MVEEVNWPVALVTGGARRIGAVISKKLAAHSWSVVIHHNTSITEADELADTINRQGGHSATVRSDLSDSAALSGLMKQAGRAFGPVSLLVNNASVYIQDELGTLDDETWDHQFAVNIRAPVFLAQAFAAQLPAGISGNIINLIDQRVWKTTPQAMSYSLSKSALYTATRMMAQALAPAIRVNGIGPGPTYPNPADGAEGLAAEAAGTLMGRTISAEEIADAVLFLISSPSLTGQMLAIDGGQHLAWQTPDIVDNTR